MNTQPNEKEMATSFIEFDCANCHSRLKVPISIAGRKARCPNCQSVAQVPASQPTIPPLPAPASVPAPAIQTHVPPIQRQPAPMSGVAPGPPPPPRAASQLLPGIAPSQSAALEKTEFPNWESGSSHSGAVTSKNAADQVPNVELPAVEDTPARRLFERISNEIAKIFVGQRELVQGTLVALFSGGHVLIESVPGLGKTLFVRTLGKILGCSFGRIQFTADLMPSDITGAPIFNMKTQEFDFRRGPVFTQFLLADEINRSPAKTHAALLEIMQEKTVTVDGKTHELQAPFLVLATQNPIESEGTYNLPEAQLDRFMFKLVADYPSAEQEARILQMHSGQDDLDERLRTELQQLTEPCDIVRVTQENSQVYVDPVLVDYINQIVRLTRKWPQFFMGASPRAGIGLMQGARTLAAFNGRSFAVPDDVVQLALPALRHRVALTAEAEVEGQSVDQLLLDLIRTVEVPRINRPREH